MPKIENWGRALDTKRLKDIFAPNQVKPFAATPGGIDTRFFRETRRYPL
jgi:hypothetical protein